METERVAASTAIEAAPEAVFAVLADPSAHADIDGTGWARASLDGHRITAAGQVFRMAMYHENHPDKDYEIANRVEVFEKLEAEVLQYPNVVRLEGPTGIGSWDDPPLFVPIQLMVGPVELSMFTTLTTFGTPRDVTLEELCVELFFPADDVTEELLRRGESALPAGL